ncbi:uncharacterized protein K02A2.6-like [Ylistrum balloti]|uniref:uncharacterized protein K02A2.6-like n=1 Tax=Ylistrum balloti TaxID=509963 RepID=UPI002905F405|nr:uncharacterized protein K02A2.6-like [Ylistrum balloti]
MVTKAPVLTYFDTNKPIVMTVDSSSKGMGAAIIQDETVLTLQKYDLEVTYKPGKLLYVADTLSRAFLEETEETLVEDLAVNELYLLAYLTVSSEKYKTIKEGTENDLEMSRLRQQIMTGWPETKQEVDQQIQTYWNYRDEITCIDGLMFKVHKLIIPKSLRPEMLDRIHEAHLSMVKCKARAREVLFWPGMSTDIEEKVATCNICARHTNSNAKEPLIPHDIPNRPWAKVAMDLFELKGQHYLLSVDYFSKWPEISKLQGLTRSSVINHVKSQFSNYGIPDQVISDNGPQFASREFTKFSKDYGFQLTTTSPHYPSSNGQAERMVQTVKGLLKKANDPYLAILDYRNSPIDGIDLSPAQIFMGRRLKTTLPTATPLLKP